MARSLGDLDFFGLEEFLAPEERLARDTVRAFVEREVAPVIERHFAEGTFAMELVPRMGELGLFGANLTGYGCAGMSNVAYGLMMQELEAGDSGLRSFASVQSSLAMYAIYAFGSEEQKRRFLPEMAQGRLIGCFGLTEPDHGSDPAGMETRARRDGDGWVVNGVKRWITNGTVADVAVLWARTDDGLRGFLVEKGRRGFSTHDIQGKFSMRASITSELVFDDVRVEESERLPQAAGLKAPLSCLTQARYGIAWGAIGAARACYLCALDYTKARRQFSRPLAGYQLVQAKLVDMLTGITNAQLIALRLGQLKDRGQMRPEQVSFAKRYNVVVALEAARAARDLLGANGIVNDYPVIRHMLNLETVNTYEGTHNIHTLALGRAITGLAAFD
ncbi:MAG: acyl-CoA dehydrogenase family protein [Deltaproteobacteria bacterium]|jgi:glutaryl-CoA dehydrogenase|nr:acyl-CoA dehydrogenase family protein [Deltaproteobacteria bacterium]